MIVFFWNPSLTKLQAIYVSGLGTLSINATCVANSVYKVCLVKPALITITSKYLALTQILYKYGSKM